MKRIRYTSDRAGKPGVVAELPDERADRLVADGDAEHYEDDPSWPIRVRFRRGASVGGKTYSQGAVAALEQSDEAWEAVNRGDADLDPAPGEPVGTGRQPFPPDWVSRSEETDVPPPPPPVEAAEPRAATPPPRRPAKGAAKSAAKAAADEDAAGDDDKDDAPPQPAPKAPQRSPGANPPTPGTVHRDPHTPPKK